MANSKAAAQTYVDSRVWRNVEDVESVFEFVDELGTGSMAQVFSAIDRKSRAPVALKVVPRSALEDAEVLDSLSVEVELLRALRHPGIVTLQEPPVVCDAQSVAVVLERLEGGDVQTLLQHSGALPEKRARAIFSDVMQALAYLHEQGIVHRDVKGENVVLSQQVARGRAKLVDFGTARRLEAGATLSGLCGSPEYVAPEVAGERPYGRECDLWSAGVLAFAMLTRSYPFGMGDAAIARSAAFTAGAVELNEHAKWAGVSEMAQDLVRRLLVADPSRRLSAADALRHPWLAPLQEAKPPAPPVAARRQWHCDIGVANAIAELRIALNSRFSVGC